MLLHVALSVWKASRRGPSDFRSLSFGAALIAFGVPAVLAYQNERGYAQLRIRYPFESLEDRLPAPKLSSRESPLAPDTRCRLTRLEETIGGGGSRSWRLTMLHENAVGLFVNSFGFGVG